MKQILFLILVSLFLIQCSGSDNSEMEMVDDTSDPIDDMGDPIDDGTTGDPCAGGFVSGSININGQQELIEFAANGYTSVGKRLSLFQCTDLSPLSCLESVDYLTITDGTFTSLSGLENLQTAISVIIDDCDNLTNLEGLNSLQGAYEFWIVRNDNIVNFQGLDSFQYMKEMRILRNPNLQNLDGLESLSEMRTDGSNTFQAILRLQENDNLTSISAINGISGFFTGLEISFSDALVDFGSFDLVTELGSILIGNSNEFTSLNAFPNVINARAILIGQCNGMESIEFPSLINVDYMRLADCENLNSLQGLSALTTMNFASEDATNLEIKNCPSLTTLDGLENLSYNGSKVKINYLSASPITNACALSLLVSNYLDGTTDPPNDNTISINTSCQVGEQWLEDFDNLCNCI